MTRMWGHCHPSEYYGEIWFRINKTEQETVKILPFSMGF
jgi:hypothetical protein